MRSAENKRRRYPLDSAATLFSSIITRRWSPKFRFSAALTETVDPVLLSRALERTFQRFPYYHVRLKSGAFQFYLEELDRRIEPEPDSQYPFSPLRPEDPLLRVLFGDRSIGLEMVHALGDGFGALTFLKTLLAQYFMLQGVKVPATNGVLDVEENGCPDEFEDSYRRHFTRKVHPIPAATRAFQPGGPSRESGLVAVVTGTMDLGRILQRTRELETSVTEYLASVLAHSLHEAQQDNHPDTHLPVQVFISANLRNLFASKTLRNFSGYGCARIDPDTGDYPFEKMLADIHRQCRHVLSEESLRSRINRDCTIERNILYRSLPLFLKKRVASAMFSLFGARKSSVFFTNMGRVELPEPIRDKVERLETFADGGGKMRLLCGALTYKERLTVCFSRSFRNPIVETSFFEMLEREGIPVRVEKAFQFNSAPVGG